MNMDAIYEKSKKAHAQAKEQEKNRGKWKVIYRTMKGDKVLVRLMPMPDSVGGYFDLDVRFHSVKGDDGKFRTVMCQELFGKVCPYCKMEEKGNKNVTSRKRSIMVGFVQEKNAKGEFIHNFEEAKILIMASSVATKCNTNLQEDDDTDIDIKQYISTKSASKLVRIQKFGEGLTTEYNVTPLNKVHEFDKALVAAGVELGQNYMDILKGLYMETKRVVVEDDADEGEEDEKPQKAKKTSPKKATEDDIEDLLDDEDDTDTIEDEEEAPKKSKKAKAKKEVEDAEDEEEEVTPKKAKKSSKTKKQEVDEDEDEDEIVEDEDEDEEDKPPKKTKKTSSKAKKEEDEDEDELNDDDLEIDEDLLSDEDDE